MVRNHPGSPIKSIDYGLSYVELSVPKLSGSVPGQFRRQRRSCVLRSRKGVTEGAAVQTLERKTMMQGYSELRCLSDARMTPDGEHVGFGIETKDGHKLLVQYHLGVLGEVFSYL